MSNAKQTEQVFNGTSNNGSLQEALDQAIAQAGHGVPWRLASIEGVQGIVNSVTVRIFAVTQAGGGRPVGPEVPTSRTGTVIDISEQISICQDDAQYELITQTPEGEQRLRLRVTTAQAEHVLSDAAGTRQEVTVTGYIRRVECERMDVYDAAPAGQPAATA